MQEQIQGRINLKAQLSHQLETLTDPGLKLKVQQLYELNEVELGKLQQPQATLQQPQADADGDVPMSSVNSVGSSGAFDPEAAPAAETNDVEMATEVS